MSFPDVLLGDGTFILVCVVVVFGMLGLFISDHLDSLDECQALCEPLGLDGHPLAGSSCRCLIRPEWVEGSRR